MERSTVAWCCAARSAALGLGCSAQLWNRESFSLLGGWDDQQLLNAGLHLSRCRSVQFWYGSNRCLQLLLSAGVGGCGDLSCAFLDLLSEFSRLL